MEFLELIKKYRRIVIAILLVLIFLYSDVNARILMLFIMIVAGLLWWGWKQTIKDEVSSAVQPIQNVFSGLKQKKDEDVISTNKSDLNKARNKYLPDRG